MPKWKGFIAAHRWIMCYLHSKKEISLLFLVQKGLVTANITAILENKVKNNYNSVQKEHVTALGPVNSTSATVTPLQKKDN